MNPKYIPIIGLEIHIEPKTKSKMFCDCDAEHFRITPNTHICPVCLGLPGALPVANLKAIQLTQLIGLALNCKLAKDSKFDRKNYFYPDLPKSFQISQYDQPLCFEGYLELESGKKVGVTRVHMEEDTAKNSHHNGQTLIDFNRSGVPLAEIVSEPDFRSAEEADEYLKTVQKIVRYLGVSDCDMEKGSMRLEVNMSLATPDMFNADGSIKKFPDYKVEVKNINSFRYAKKAIAYEYKRQSSLLDQGITPDQETRGWQEAVGKTISQRSKEDAQDYRYFPAPDLPPMQFSDQDIENLKKSLPELPNARKKRFVKQYALKNDMAEFLTESRELADYFENSVKLSKRKLSSDEIAKTLKNKTYDWQKLSVQDLIKAIMDTHAEIVSDQGLIEKIVKQVLQDHPKEAERYKAGEKKLTGFFMGQIMRELKGKGDPGTLMKVLNQNLH